jgi:hypothetical protein
VNGNGHVFWQKMVCQEFLLQQWNFQTYHMFIILFDIIYTYIFFSHNGEPSY